MADGALPKRATRTAVFRAQVPEQEPLDRKMEEVSVVALPIRKLLKLKGKKYQLLRKQKLSIIKNPQISINHA